MALVKLGTTVVGIRGTVGGITFSQNKGGPHCKVFARGPVSRTPFQSEARGYMAQWSNMWRELSGGEQTDWNSFAAAPPEIDYDPFGQVVTRSGFQWLVRLNMRQVLLGALPILYAPPSVPVPAPVLDTFVMYATGHGGNLCVVSYSSTAFQPGFWAAWFLSLTPSPGVAQQRRGFQLVWFDYPYGATQTVLDAGAILKFRSWPAGWLATLNCYQQSPTAVRSSVVVMRATIAP